MAIQFMIEKRKNVLDVQCTDSLPPQTSCGGHAQSLRVAHAVAVAVHPEAGTRTCAGAGTQRIQPQHARQHLLRT